jgi:hypothetical protein
MPAALSEVEGEEHWVHFALRHGLHGWALRLWLINWKSSLGHAVAESDLGWRLDEPLLRVCESANQVGRPRLDRPLRVRGVGRQFDQRDTWSVGAMCISLGQAFILRQHFHAVRTVVLVQHDNPLPALQLLADVDVRDQRERLADPLLRLEDDQFIVHADQPIVSQNRRRKSGGQMP